MRTRDSAIQSRTTPCSAMRPAEGDPLGRAAAHGLDGDLGQADRAHAVVDPAGAEAGLGDGEARALLADEVARRHPDVGEAQLGVTAVVVVVVAEDLHAAHDLDTRGVARHEDHRLLAVPVGVGVGLAHDDEDLALGVHRAGDPPLAAVDDVVVAVAHGCACAMLVASLLATSGSVIANAERISPRSNGFSHRSCCSALPNWAQHLHVAGVGRRAVEDGRGEADAAAGDLGERGVLEVRQAGAVLAGQEDVPQARGRGPPGAAPAAPARCSTPSGPAAPRPARRRRAATGRCARP